MFSQGKYYAVNIPLRDGMDDESYESIFVPIISKVMETFQPSAVVLQCGADSLTGIHKYHLVKSNEGNKKKIKLIHVICRRSVRLFQFNSEGSWEMC